MAARRSIVFAGLGLSLAACPRYAPLDEATTGVGGTSDVVVSSSGDSDASSSVSIVVSATATGAGGAGGAGGASNEACLSCASLNCPDAVSCFGTPACFAGVQCLQAKCIKDMMLDDVCALECFMGDKRVLAQAVKGLQCLQEKCLAPCFG